MKKQIIAKLLVLCMVVSMLPAFSLTGRAAESSAANNGCYTYCGHGCDCANSAYCTCGGAGVDCDCPICASLGLHSAPASNSGNTSSTSGSSSTGETETAPAETAPVVAKVEVAATVEGEKATAAVTEKAVTDAIADAIKAAGTAGNAPIVVEITIEATGDNLTEVEVTIPASAFAGIANAAGDASVKVTLALPVSHMQLSLGQGALDTLAAGSGNVDLDAKKQPVTRGVRRSAEAPEGYTINITEGDEVLTDLPFSVSVDAPADAGVTCGAVVVVGGDECVDKLSVAKDGTAYVNLPGSASFYLDELTAKEFTDVPGWAQSYVDFVSARGLFNGATDTTYEPAENITRGQLVAVLYRMAGEPAVASRSNLTDVKENWYYADAISWAVQNGIASGSTSNTFEPDDNATREELASMLYKYADYAGLDTSARGDLSKFSDGSSVSPSEKTALEWAVGVHVFQGDTTGAAPAITPTADVERSAVAAALYRCCLYLAGLDI